MIFLLYLTLLTCLLIHPSATSSQHVEAHSRFAVLFHEFLDWMEVSRLNLDRLDGLSYVGRESAIDTTKKIEALQHDCRQGQTLLSKVGLLLVFVGSILSLPRYFGHL